MPVVLHLPSLSRPAQLSAACSILTIVEGGRPAAEWPHVAADIYEALKICFAFLLTFANCLILFMRFEFLEILVSKICFGLIIAAVWVMPKSL